MDEIRDARRIGERQHLDLSAKTCAQEIWSIRELSSQIAIYRNVIYVNDLTAALRGQDFVRADGRLAVDAPYRYKGSLAANISDLSQFKPLLAAIGNKNELAGSLVLDWNGSGQAANFNNSGEVKLAVEQGRYANLQSLQARVEGTYAPDGLSVPIIYFGSDKMSFQAVGESNGTTLEISKIQIDSGEIEIRHRLLPRCRSSGKMSRPINRSSIRMGKSQSRFNPRIST